MLNQDSVFYGNYSADMNSEQCYEQESNRHEVYLDQIQPIQENGHSLFNQSSLQNSQNNQSQTQKKEQRVKYNYKNVPKQIGNNLCKYATKNHQNNMPPGLRLLVEDRGREKKLQSKTTIAQLRKTCQADQLSQKIFKKYIKKQFLVDLVQSNKITDPLQYISAITNYYACAQEPDKMIGSQLTMTLEK